VKYVGILISPTVEGVVYWRSGNNSNGRVSVQNSIRILPECTFVKIQSIHFNIYKIIIL